MINLKHVSITVHKAAGAVLLQKSSLVALDQFSLGQLSL